MTMSKKTKTGRIRTGLMIILVLVMCMQICSACSSSPKKKALQVLIIPKFEVGEMSGDFPGEAQLFYEKYCPDCEEIEIPHLPQTAHFYLNEKNGVGILVTDSGKTAAGLSLMAVLSSGFYDYSDTRIVSVGCGGGSAGNCTLGDVILVTAVCDYDLGHHVDAHERKKSSSHVMWFPDDSYADYEYQYLNADLYQKTYEMIKDCPLRTTEQAKTVMKENFEGILTAMAPALFEEVIFRGIFISNLKKDNKGSMYCLFVTAAVFALLHLTNIVGMDMTSVFVQFCYSFVIGLVLAAVYLKNGSLLQVVIVHFLIDFTSRIFVEQASISSIVHLILFSVLLAAEAVYAIAITRFN